MESELAYNIKIFEETLENITNFLINDNENNNNNNNNSNNNNN